MTLAPEVNDSILDETAISAALNQQPMDIGALKQALEQTREAQYRRFRSGEFVADLVRDRTRAIDALLHRLWHHFDWPRQAALVAVGGYGRGELLPHSDIDLLLLFRTEQDIEAHVESVQAFITLLWDLNLDIGHSVRTLDACIDEATEDLTIVTNLLEARLLEGDQSLFDAMQAATDAAHIWPSASFFKAKMNEQVHRYEKYGDTAYNLEPNIKSSPGGLRDIQTIGWVVKRHFGDDRLEELVSRGFLTQNEFQTLIDGQNYLWRIRYALHLLAGREEDRLLFDLQKAVAELFGFRDSEEALGVEQLMKTYYRTVFHLRELNEMLLQHFEEALLSQDKDTEPRRLNNRFQVRNNYLEMTSPEVFQRTPSALMEVFVLLAENPELKGIRASTIRSIFAHRHLIDPAFRNDIRNSSFFIELMRSPQGVSTNLRRMNRYGVLGLYLPEFGDVIGQMQFDLFHVYTVDAHSLKTVQNLRRFRHRANLVEFPLACRIIHLLPKVDLLYIAGLFHDLGKGKGGDHSEIGAELAHQFCHRHRLPDWDTDLVVWLVENHLLMSLTAQREDVSDPDVIHRFTEKVQDLVHLDYLYVLTVADIHATNPSLWNSWRAALLKQLYTESKLALRRGLENPVGKEERIEDTKRKAISILAADGYAEDEIRGFWKNPGDDYFLRETAENIAWHTKAICQQGEGVPLVLVQELNEGAFESATQIFIYGPDRINLFADIAYVMDQLQLNIHDARIMTSPSSGYSLDTFIVLEEDDSPIDMRDTERLRDIQHRLLMAVAEPPERKPSTRRVPRTLKHFNIPTRVTLSNDLLNERTIVEVITTDRPGLLALIGEVFIDIGVYLQSARISTLGERVEDVFFVVDADNRPLQDGELSERLRAELTRKLNELTEQTHA
ncbi:[protein-PII] uridylyltransferase [Natronospirillum operosum]|uniref:Bifunctional uridylyltransferase/uridylyl-removing enzyme n=1 Tax=Natronospirillum operosum TaxID=2759953 RepID=A0A4Z0WES0_9GAMM|nr:[protein-PII] uridylyltransferase [Natronospirillum operosum]TGG95118.1 [protein-PII] uridylyltransferase [Natronospirillum operosum]